jgi:hypothetical protein
MIGKLTGAMGRRGILRGAVGLGAAVGLGGAGQVTTGAPITGLMPPRVDYQGGLKQAVGVPPAVSDRPDWLKALDSEAEAMAEREGMRPRVDTLDLDLAALRGPSPAWKLTQQKARDKVRREASKTLWQRIDDATTRWRRSIGQ